MNIDKGLNFQNKNEVHIPILLYQKHILVKFYQCECLSKLVEKFIKESPLKAHNFLIKQNNATIHNSKALIFRYFMAHPFWYKLITELKLNVKKIIIY